MQNYLYNINSHINLSKYAFVLLYFIVFSALLNVQLTSDFSLNIQSAYAQVDSDGDGISDEDEIANGTDPNDANLTSDCIAASRSINTRVDENGVFGLFNVPTEDGLFRVRVFCEIDGQTVKGQSGLFEQVIGGVTDVGPISLANFTPLPVSLEVVAPTVVISQPGETLQLDAVLEFSDGSTVTANTAAEGTTWFTSTPSVATVDANGLVTGVGSSPTNNAAFIGARNEGIQGTVRISLSNILDADNDGLPDEYEIANGLNPNDPDDANDDNDTDGLTNIEEFNLNTNPNNSDTDGDGVSDSEEVTISTDPLVADTDGDGLIDGDELQIGTDPLLVDTDGDGISDGNEISSGLDPLNANITTNVIGTVTDSNSELIENATVTVFSLFTTTTASDGTFTIHDVPTELGDIVVNVRAIVDGTALNGNSPAVPGIDDGITDVGTIQVTDSSGTVSGIVSDETGGVSGVQVTIGSGAFIQTTNTDSAGFYQFIDVPPGNVSISAFDPGTGLRGVTSGELINNESLILDVSLSSFGTIFGRVLQRDNETTVGPGITVVLNDQFSDFSVTTQTDEFGEYRFELLPLSLYRIRALDGPLNKGLTEVSLTIANQVIESDITYLGLGTVTGTAVSIDGNPISGADIQLQSESLFGGEFTTTSDGNGNFTINNVFVGLFTIVGENPTNNQSGFAEGSIEFDGDLKEITVIIGPSATITGTVFESDGITPVGSAEVTISPLVGGGSFASTDTNADGSYIFPNVSLGNYKIKVLAANEDRKVSFVSLLEDGQVVNRDINLNGLGTVTVNVKDFNGNVVPNANVRLLSLLFPQCRQELTGKTDSSGNITFSNVVAGAFQLFASDPNELLSAAETSEVGINETVNIEMVLEPSATITGTVYDFGGTEPVANFKVALVSRFGGAFLETVTNPDGTYSFDMVPLGTYGLNALDNFDTIWAEQEDIVLENNNEVISVDLVLRGKGTVQGTIFNPDNSFASSVKVVLKAPFNNNTYNFPSKNTFTNANGFYKFENIIADNFNLQITVDDKPNRFSGSALDILENNGDVLNIDINLVPSQGLVDTLYDANGFEYEITRSGSILEGKNEVFNSSNQFFIDLNNDCDEFDKGSMFLCMFDENGEPFGFEGFAAGFEENNREIVIDGLGPSGLSVQRKIFIPQDGYFTRYLEVFTNNTPLPITIDARVETNYKISGVKVSSIAIPQIITTSDSNAVLESQDTWAVFDDNDDTDPFFLEEISPFVARTQPATVQVFHDGNGNISSTDITYDPLINFEPDNANGRLEDQYDDITINPGETKILMHFVAQQTTRSSAIATAERLVQLPPEALAGLSTEELSQIQNFNVPLDGNSQLAALPPLTGTVNGNVFDFDGITPVFDSEVEFNSTSPYYDRTYILGNLDDDYSIQQSFSPEENPVVIPLLPFDVRGVHPLTGAISPDFSSDFQSGNPTSQDVVFSNVSTITGVVRRADGTPVTEGDVNTTIITTRNSRLITTEASVEIQSDGTYTIDGMPEGVFTLVADVPNPQGTNLGGSSFVTVTPGQLISEQDITIEPTGGIEGEILTSQGNLAVDVPVELESLTTNFRRETRTGTGGRYQFLDVIPGEYVLSVFDPVNREGTNKLVEVLVDVVSISNITISGTGSANLRVSYSDDSSPVFNSKIAVKDSGSNRFRFAGYTDNNGELFIENISVGDYEIAIGNPVTENIIKTLSGRITSNEVDQFNVTVDRDTDGDGLLDADETGIHGTDPFNSDTDGDGLNDKYEVDNNLEPVSTDNSQGDPDNDGLTNIEEFNAGTNPNSEDTDNDGNSDGFEIANLCNPLGDETTTVVGTITDVNESPINGASVQVLNRTELSGANGTFAINIDLQCPPQSIQVQAGVVQNGSEIFGVSNETTPNVPGITNVGTIVLDEFSDRQFLEQVKFSSDDLQGSARFGTQVEIFGNTAVIAASQHTVNSVNDSGAVYVYEFDPVNNVWEQQQQLTAPSNQEGDMFGFDIAYDGSTIVVGTFDADAVHVFTKNATSGMWEPFQVLTPSIVGNVNQFGRSVDISGSYIVVGSYDDNIDTEDPGRAYIFEFNALSNNWEELQIISPESLQQGGRFGSDIAIQNDIIVVSAPYTNESALQRNVGAVYIFKQDQTSGLWADLQNLILEELGSDDKFGTAIELLNNTLVVGASGDGKAYVFRKSPFDGFFRKIQELTPSEEDGVTGDFGSAIAITPFYVVIGAESQDNVKQTSGAVYTFEKDFTTGTYSETQKLVQSDESDFAFFGWSLAMNGEVLLVGAPQDQNNGNVYYFREFGGLLREHCFDGLDNDNDGHIDVNDSDCLDDDSDKVLNFEEILIGTNQNNADTDGDGLLDGFEVANGLDPISTNEASQDPDNDGLTNLEEQNINTNPFNSDTDGDGFDDAFEATNNCNPTGQEHTIIGGRVLDFFDQPVQNAEVSIFGNVGYTDNSGFFNFTVLIGCGNNTITVFASTQINNIEVVGLSPSTPAVFNGTTDVGDIVLNISTLVSSDFEPFDRFGSSVSISRDYAVVGSPFDTIDTGSAYIFKRDNTTGAWVEIQKLVASDADRLDEFGSSVSIDGDILIIGAKRKGALSGGGGAAYIFELDPATGVWQEVQKIESSDIAEDDRFGVSVTIKNDYAVVGADFDDDGNTNNGSAYVFKRNPETGVWSQTQKILARDSGSHDLFGGSVSLSGNKLLIGARGNSQGTAYLFELDGTSGLWNQVQRLRPEGTSTSTRLDFGKSVALDGNRAIIGSKDNEIGIDTGAAYIFEFDLRTMSFVEVQKLLASDGSDGDDFGASVAIFNNLVMVGAPSVDGLNIDSGAAYFYERDSSTQTWNEVKRIKALNTNDNDSFGVSVAVDGGRFLIGGLFFSDNDGFAYLFELNEEFLEICSDGIDNDFDGDIDELDSECVDTDGDGLADRDEEIIGTDPNNTDTDGDGLLDGYEISEGFDPVNTNEGGLDADNDGLTNLEEQSLGTDPNDDDTDDDGISDGFEVSSGCNPFGEEIATVSGRVVDNTNNPLEGAVVNANSVEILTGINGLFTFDIVLSCPARDVNVIVTFDNNGVQLIGNVRVQPIILGSIDIGDIVLNEIVGEPTLWVKEQKLSANDDVPDDFFGSSIAIKGRNAVVGAPGFNSSSGATYVFNRDETTGEWVQFQKLLPLESIEGDEFGRSVSISKDRILIGANCIIEEEGPGSAYIFELNETTGLWERDIQIFSQDGDFGDRFGTSVSIRGNLAVIGAPSNNNIGAAYIFEYNPLTSAWFQQQKITPSNGLDNDSFGNSVSMFENRVIVGSFRDDDNGQSSGSAYLFERNEINGVWQELQQLTPLDASEGDDFGQSVAIYKDTIIIGAPDNGQRGSAYIFSFDETTNQWIEQQKLIASDNELIDNFGINVDIFEDIVFVGASEDSTYIFTKDENTQLWIESQKLTSEFGEDINDELGINISISGNIGAVSSFTRDDIGQIIDRSVYVLQEVDGVEEEICDDLIDNDENSSIDCDDLFCQNEFICLDPTASNTEICDDLIDNDSDGFVDCSDFGCRFDSNCGIGETVCFDEIDNDGDELIDCEDPDCFNDPSNECGELGETDCEDGIDNDFDGFADCADFDCVGVGDCPLDEELNCTDGIDNDGDGFIDCADQDCSFELACD